MFAGQNPVAATSEAGWLNWDFSTNTVSIQKNTVDPRMSGLPEERTIPLMGAMLKAEPAGGWRPQSRPPQQRSLAVTTAVVRTARPTFMARLHRQADGR